MFDNKNLQYISSILTQWYQKNKRNLPWRDIHDPYRIWISEIILQQTRVVQGYDYFLKFTEWFPNVKSLATATEDEVLKCWQGLGYYSRARNLHAAAKQIMHDYNGEFPSSYDDIRSLKGIGDYTAAAIASFAFKLPYAVVDGNVFRFLSRYFGIDTPIDSTAGKKQFFQLAAALLDRQNPDSHNQAIMEFGALQCTPASPDCNNCPLQNSCFAKENAQIQNLPVKEKKTKVSHRYFHYFVIVSDEQTVLNKRTGKDIWQNLYEFPLYESQSPMTSAEILQSEWFSQFFASTRILDIIPTPETKHILSHQIIHTSFYIVKTEAIHLLPDHYTTLAITGLAEFPVSRLTEKFIKKFSKSLEFLKS